MTLDKPTLVLRILNKLSAVRSCGLANVTAASETLMLRSLLVTMANWIWSEFWGNFEFMSKHLVESWKLLSG